MLAIIDRFENYLNDHDRTRNTVNGYVQDLELFASWFKEENGEDLTAENLTPTDVRLYRQWMQETARLKPATINRRLSALRGFGEALQEMGIAQANPAHGVRGVEEQVTAPKWLDKKQQAALTRALERGQATAKTDFEKWQARRDRAAALLILNTGLRVSEVCSLDLADVELSERKGTLYVRNGKGSKARTIPLNRTVRGAIDDWVELRGKEEGKLFTGKRGNALTPSGLQRRLEEIGRGVRLEITPHTLRHSFAKNLVDVGVTLEKVAMLLGHSNLNTTRIYIMPSQRDLAQAVGLLDL